MQNGGDELLRQWRGCGVRRCGLGCPFLDSFLRGGFPCGSITELVGESGAAKTQICLQLLLAAQLPPCQNGLLASSLYIYTEGYFPSRRLHQLAAAFVAAGKFNPLPLPPDHPTNAVALHRQEHNPRMVEVPAETRNPCDNVFVQAIETIEELFAFLHQAQHLLSKPLSMPVKVVVIDSIAALFRSDFDNTATDLAKRAEWFFKVSSRLKLYAHKFDLAVVVTNQVVDHVETEALRSNNCLTEMLSESPQPLISSGRRVVPALGLSWSHCVNMRVFLSRTFDLDQRSQLLDLHGSPPHSISQRPAIEGSFNLQRVGLDRCLYPQPQFSVLERLESELPDALLLRFSPRKATEQSLVCNSCNIDEKSQCAHLSVLNEKIESGLSAFNKEALHISNLAAGRHSTVGLRRTLQIVFAPHLPASCCEFVVETNHVRGIPSTPCMSVGDDLT